MKMKLFYLIAAVLAAVAVPSMGARASIYSNTDGTFTDSITGYVWMDIEIFYNKTYFEDQALILPGFAFATQSQVLDLTSHTGINAATTDVQFLDVALSMGAPQPGALGRYVIWARYGDGTGYYYTWGPQSNPPGWLYNNDVPAHVHPEMGAFVVNTSPISAVPLPAALPLFATGLGALGLLGWHRKRKAAATT